MMIFSFYRERINYIFDKLSRNNRNFIVFFKGFPPCFYQELDTSSYFGLKKSHYTNADNYIDAKGLFESKNNLMIQFLTANKDKMWGYYEEFIALTESLSNIQEIFNGDIYIINNNLFEQYYFLDVDKKIKEQLWDYYNTDHIQIDTSIEPYTKLYSNIVKYGQNEYALSYINKHKDEDIEVIEFYDHPDFSPSNGENQDKCKIYYVNDGRFELLKNNLQRGGHSEPIQMIVENEEDKRKISPFITVANMLSLPLYISYNNKFVNVESNKEDTYLPLLKAFWGPESEFRKLKIYKNPEVSSELIEISQGFIISDIIAQCEKAIKGEETYRDIFITSPTGSGKSLLFQIPAIHLAMTKKTITIVITPLIALMQDQVESLQNKHIVSFATFINSDISFQDREHRLYGIKNGEYSIVYMSPEFFLAHSLTEIIGERLIGLLVIDEAHLVTSWGRDFRSDYWYLGDYVEKQRNSLNYSFPILCLTATAVYLGNDDVVFDTISSLNLRNHKLYLGNVRRDDLLFDIRYISNNQINENIDNFKIHKTVEQIEQFYQKGTKSIVYCPYTSQVDEIYQSLPNSIKQAVGKYHGKLDKYEKQYSYENFKNGKYTIMICTKAFGMGIDIDDIEVVYHYAPTGNLADYVQEIGRSARKKDLFGIAMTDFTDKDMKYVRMLYGLSNIKQYQLKEMVRKIYQIYKEKGSRNFLISTDAFSYLFLGNDIENKVKNGLLLIAKDLEEHSKFPNLIVRPKSMFTKNFINVPHEIENEFLQGFNQFVKKVENINPRIIPTTNNNNSDTVVYYGGTIYEINMARLWEQRFNDLTFAQFKWKFFNGELLKFQDGYKISPNVQVIIHYEKSFDEVSSLFKRYIQTISSIMAYFRRMNRYFTKKQFREIFYQKSVENNKYREISNLILDSFIADISQNIGFNQNRDPLKFIQQRKAQNRDEMEYRIINSNYTRLVPYFSRLLEQSKPNINDHTFLTFLPLSRGQEQHQLIQLTFYLELFGLASYEIIGGKNTEIFLRVNDPAKLRKISEGDYTNNILKDIERKKKRSEKILSKFLRAKLTNKQRWDVIEDYFLGREEKVAQALGIELSDIHLV